MADLATLAKFRVTVRAHRKTVHYGDLLHFPSTEQHPRAGAPFIIGQDALRRDADGRVLVDKQNRPILPRFVEALEPVPALDPKSTPVIVVSDQEIEKYRKSAGSEGRKPKAVAVRPSKPQRGGDDESDSVI